MGDFVWMWGDTNTIARVNPLRRSKGSAFRLLAELQAHLGSTRPVLVAKTVNRSRMDWVKCQGIAEAMLLLEDLNTIQMMKRREYCSLLPRRSAWSRRWRDFRKWCARVRGLQQPRLQPDRETTPKPLFASTSVSSDAPKCKQHQLLLDDAEADYNTLYG